ncbi:hypothetical protein KAU19_05255 [Candidatus Parcubacteria bacterium]|nr:hypothetical protein [Candidatus Parcubacteria bacterium]
METIKEIQRFVQSYSSDESIASIITEEMKKQLEEIPHPPNYYYVTDLTNPAQTFFSRLNPEVKKSKELALKLAQGKRLHNLTGGWFRKLDNFIVEEGTIDGFLNGLPGVRGKIDYRVGGSIFELKTKDYLPETPEEIISSFPQDLEQLAFYSVIHPSKPKINYLVFMENSPPYEFKAFKVTTNEFGTIKSILKNRMNELNKTIETNDPSRLGRCRYYGDGCQFEDSKSCSCENLKPIDTNLLQRSLEINFDKKFTDKLEEIKKESQTSNYSLFTTYEIIAPRKRYMKTILGIDSPYREEKLDIDKYKTCLWSSVKNFQKKYDMELSKFDKQAVIESQRESRTWIGFRWLNLKSSIHQEGQIVPYLLKVNQSSNAQYSTSPSSYYLAELGLVCAAYGKSKGLIFTIYPNLDELVHVFQITYKNINALTKIISERIDCLEKAEKNHDLLSLPSCPKFMNENGNCPLMDECNSIKGKGCTS